MNIMILTMKTMHNNTILIRLERELFFMNDINEIMCVRQNVSAKKENI